MRQLSFLAESAGASSPSVIARHNSGRPCRTASTDPVRARRSDPATSHQAADAVTAFAGSHYQRIERALQAVPNATPHELTKPTGLTVVQIDRRLPELERQGRARVVIVDGEPLQRGAARVWEAVR